MSLCAIHPSFSIDKILVDSDGKVIMIDSDNIPNTLTCQPTGTIYGYAANPFPTSISAGWPGTGYIGRYTSALKYWTDIPGFPSRFDRTYWQLIDLRLVLSSGTLSWRVRVLTYSYVTGRTNYLYYYQATKPFTASSASPKGIYNTWELYDGSDITPAQMTLGALTIT